MHPTLKLIKETAEAATPGPWEATVCLGVHFIQTGDASALIVADDTTKADAAHIALLNPQTALKLVEALDEALTILLAHSDLPGHLILHETISNILPNEQ